METVIEIERSPQSNFHIILLLTPGSPMDSCHGNPSPSDPVSKSLSKSDPVSKSLKLTADIPRASKDYLLSLLNRWSFFVVFSLIADSIC